ncbi:hypothetical protein BASA81_000923 [Batrachochytrium salamandrivorans]|nr:hypothetical protein BASA81_000923 [Batrachochytrium salamandrivorans]
MKMVRHVHVVSLKEVLASRTKIFIVLELVTGGELFDKIVAEGKFNETTARKYFQQLVAGTSYCHKQQVCHRDLKPENLLLDAEENLKISDFGLSSLYEQAAGETDRRTLLHTTCGTPNYVAPEVLADKGYDGAMADTWSIGVILFVFLAGFLPFDEATMSALFKKIQKAEFTYPSWFTDEVKDLIGKILVVDPKQRWNMDQIRQHSWWKKDGPYALEDPTQNGRLEEAQNGGELLDDVDEHEHNKAAAATSSQSAGSAEAEKRIPVGEFLQLVLGSTANEGGDAILNQVLAASQRIPGLVDTKLDGEEVRSVFDLGHGHVHVLISVDHAGVLSFRRAKGDLLSFGKIWESIQKMAQQRGGV